MTKRKKTMKLHKQRWIVSKNIQFFVSIHRSNKCNGNYLCVCVGNKIIDDNNHICYVDKKNRYRFLLFVLMSIFFVIVVVVDFHLWFDFIFFAIAIMIIIRNENNKNPFIFDKTSKNIIIMFVGNETKITFFGSQKKKKCSWNQKKVRHSHFLFIVIVLSITKNSFIIVLVYLCFVMRKI